jgi:NitT/TauT family transport system substrate-binding protein
VRQLGLAVLLIAIAWAGGCAPAALPAPPTPSPAAPSRSTAPPVAPAPTAAPRSPDSVRVSYTSGLAGALQVAIARGYFAEQGIDLRREEFGSTAEAMAPLTTGELDAGSTTPNASLFNALARGVRLRLALAGTYIEPGTNYLPLMVRLGPDGAPVARDVAELRGKRIAQNQRGVISEWALDRLLGEANLRLDDVELTIMPFPDTLVALGGGSIDAVVMPEPFGTIAELRGLAARVRDAGEVIPGGQVAVMSFSERFASERPEVAKRWAVAYLRGARDYMDAMELGRDREAVVALLAQMSGLDAGLIERAGYGAVRRDGRVDAAALEAMLDWLVARGYVPQRPDLAPVLDTQFADYAARVLDGQREAGH